MTDSAFLWALVLDRLRSGTAPDVALAATIDAVEAAGGTGRFNFLLTDGRTIVATTAGDTLWYRRADERRDRRLGTLRRRTRLDRSARPRTAHRRTRRRPDASRAA